MKFNEIIQGTELHEKLKRGIKNLASIVKRTLGPGGLPIIIQRDGQSIDGRPLNPLVTKDGVTVSESIKKVKDPDENNAIQAIKEVARKTNTEAGDGTTTAVLLAEAIYNEAVKYVLTGSEPQRLLEEINSAANRVEQFLVEKAQQVSTKDDIINVATISANNQRDIGELIADAIDKVGEDGVITIEEGMSRTTTLKVVEGFQVDKGLIAPVFSTHPGLCEAHLKDCDVVVYDGEITSAIELSNVLGKVFDVDETGEKIKNPGKNVLFIANDIVGEALSVLALNKQHLKLAIAAIKSPNVGSVRTQMLEDICVLLGANLLGNGRKSLEMATSEDFGHAKRVVAGKWKTLIFDGYGDAAEVLERIDTLKQLREQAESEYDKDQINMRIAQLSNGVAVIGVGGATDIEMKEKKDRIEDALNATRAAISEGIVPGGGIALLRARDVLTNKNLGFDTEGDKILFNALEKPIRQIIENTGKNADVIISNVLKTVFENGYNARTHQFVDMVKDGIIDPVKVTKSALKNSISIAGLLITCGGSITEQGE